MRDRKGKIPVVKSEAEKRERLQHLLTQAERAGATRAAILPAHCVQVEEELAAFCRHPRCPFWGLSLSCPPHVAGPEGFSQLLRTCKDVLVVRLEVQACSLQGGERPQVFRLLHELVASVELRAQALGFTDAAGFAGGSCKASFCADKTKCSVLAGRGKCRYPDQARPSLSGYGVNVGTLMRAAGWDSELFASGNEMSWLAGLVLLPSLDSR